MMNEKEFKSILEKNSGKFIMHEHFIYQWKNTYLKFEIKQKGK